MDVGGRVKANIKRKVSNPKGGLGKKAKNQSLVGHTKEKDFLSKHGSSLYKYHDHPLSSDQNLTFQAHALQIILSGSSTCEPNIILGSLQIESLQLAPSVGKACALAQAVDREGPSITSSSPLLCPNIKSH